MNDKQLSPSDLQLLGKFYSNNFRLAVEDDGRNVQLVPPRSTWIPLTIMTLIISLFYGGFLYVANLVKLTGIRVLIAESKGIFRSGDVRIRELDDDKR